MNKAIVIAAVGITGVGMVNATIEHKPIDKVVLGGYMLALALSIFDLFGGGVSQITGAIAMLALATALVTAIDWLQLFGATQDKIRGGGGAHPTSH